MKKLLISLFDHSGNVSEHYRNDPNWDVIQIDIKQNQDILTWDYEKAFHLWRLNYFEISLNLREGQTYDARIIQVGIICMIPCTDYALSGSKHFDRKDSDGSTKASQLLVAKSKEIIDWFGQNTNLVFWQIENPMSRIHTLNPWLGKVKFKFDPCDFSGYNDFSRQYLNWLRTLDPKGLTKSEKKFIIEDSNAYNKKTWLWGKFNIPIKKRIEPAFKESPIWSLYGGKSERTKELRSITPIGFCKAFYEANK